MTKAAFSPNLNSTIKGQSFNQNFHCIPVLRRYRIIGMKFTNLSYLLRFPIHIRLLRIQIEPDI